MIRINGDSDFTSANGVVSGSGTKDDPYVIAGWDIDAHGAGNAIYIGNTTKYFIVHDCYLHNTSYHSWPYYYGGGIMLYNVINGIVSGNTISDNWNGGDGIEIVYSSRSKIENNTINDNLWYGIMLYSSSNNVIYNNTISYHYDGVILYSSNSNTIENNEISNNYDSGISVIYSNDNTLKNNRMYKNGIFLYGDKDTFTTQEIDTSNTVNDKPVYYYKNTNMGNVDVPQDAGEVLLGNVSYLRIENLRLENSTIGIEMGYSDHIYVANNIIRNNNEGIRLYSSASNTIRNNNISSSGYGVSLAYCSNSSIDNNTISFNFMGIYIYYSSSTITRNFITRNTYYSIYIDNGDNNLIYNNSFYYNHGSGDTYDASHIQAYDGGTNNHWNSMYGVGNYWHDWANNNDTNDQNRDGIVDWPYKLAGNAGVKDYYPLKGDPKNGFEPLTYPNNLQAVAGDGYVNLAWDSPVCDGGSDITTYKIYRGTSSGGETYLTSVSGSTLTYTDTSVTNGVTYYYYVTAVNDAGESDTSNEVSIKPLTVPSAPRNFQVIRGDGYVELRWNSPANDGGDIIEKYRIYRNGGLLAEVESDVYEYNDTKVDLRENYSYYVVAVNGVGEGERTDVVEVWWATPTLTDVKVKVDGENI